MFFLNLIKILFLFFFIYLLYQLIKFFFRMNKNIKNNAKKMHETKKPGGDDNNVIELDKDQYKVE